MSVDRLIRKPIGGPDRGETPVIKETIITPPAALESTHPLLERSSRPPVSVDRGFVPDTYGKNVKPMELSGDQLRLDLRGNLTLRNRG